MFTQHVITQTHISGPHNIFLYHIQSSDYNAIYGSDILTRCVEYVDCFKVTYRTNAKCMTPYATDHTGIKRE